MTKSLEEGLYAAGHIDESTLFDLLFSTTSLQTLFNAQFAHSIGKGTDRLNGFQFAIRAPAELAIASAKCKAGSYRFAPYLEVLKTKGRNKAPCVLNERTGVRRCLPAMDDDVPRPIDPSNLPFESKSMSVEGFDHPCRA